MTDDRGNNKDALLEKLDNLMRSGRATKRHDPPPMLTDAIPKGSESNIPTLTDVVSTPDANPDAAPVADTGSAGSEFTTESQEDASLETEFASSDDSDRRESNRDEPLEFERIEGFSRPRQGPDDIEQQAPANPQETTSVDREQHEIDDVGQQTPVVLHESISERLLDVLDQEMSDLLKELPSEKSKLSVLHRSLRFALPELVRLRWLEPTADGTHEGKSEGGSEAED